MAFSHRTWVLSGIAVILLIAVVCAFPFRPSSQPAPAADASSPSALGSVPTPKDIPALVTLLQNPDPAQAVAAAERLGYARSPEAVAPLLAAAGDSRPPVQTAAITAVTRLQQKVDPAPFVQIVESTPYAAVRAAGLDFLASQRVEGAVGLMMKYLEDPDLEVRGRAYAGIRAVTCRDYNFRADDPLEKRQEAIRRMRLTIRYHQSGEGPVQ